MPHRQGGRQNQVPNMLTKSGSRVVVRPLARRKRNFRLLIVDMKAEKDRRKAGWKKEGKRERMGEREGERKEGGQAGRKGKEEAFTEFKDS